MTEESLAKVVIPVKTGMTVKGLLGLLQEPRKIKKNPENIRKKLKISVNLIYQIIFYKFSNKKSIILNSRKELNHATLSQ
jgi:hypothetical protein